MIFLENFQYSFYLRFHKEYNSFKEEEQKLYKFMQLLFSIILFSIK